VEQKEISNSEPGPEQKKRKREIKKKKIV